MNIKLKINGREGSAVEGAVLAKVKEQMTQKLSQTSKFEIAGDSIQNLKIHFRPCCEWMREEAERVLNQK